MISRILIATIFCAAAFAQAPPAEHKEIKLDPKSFDRYAGTYQLAPTVLLTMSREGERFYIQVTGQDKVEMFAESAQKFFLKEVDAQLTFDDEAKQVTLHQGGQDMGARRMNADEARRAQEEIDKRLKEKKPAPGAEEAIRRSIQELRSGAPNYELMSPQLAEATRQQLPQLQSAMEQLGALQSLKFKEVGASGEDVYEVGFEHARTEWRIVLGAGGKMTGLTFRPL